MSPSRNCGSVPYDTPLDELDRLIEGGWPGCWPAIAVLGQRSEPEARRRLIGLCRPRDEHVRRSALDALGRGEPSAEATAVVREALEDRHPFVVRQALRCTGHWRLVELTERVRLLTADPDPETRHEAVNALGVLDATLPAVLLRMLRADPDAEVRKRAARALVKRADESTWLEAFTLLARHETPQMRVLAARIATRCGDASVRSELERLARDRDGHVRDEARRALDRIEGSGS